MSSFVESLLSTVARIFFKKNANLQIVLQDVRDELGENLRHHTVYSVELTDVPQEAEMAPTLIAHTERNAERQIGQRNVIEQREKIEHIRKEYGEAALPVQKTRIARAKWKAAFRMNILYNKLNPTIPQNLCIGPKDFCLFFPYHIIFDRQMKLMQSGVQMQNIVSAFRNEGVVITQYLQLIFPVHTEFNFSNVEDMQDCPHVVRVLDNSLVGSGRIKDILCFRGQMSKLMENGYMLFLCSPLVNNLSVIEKNGMRISEIPNHDLTKYFVTFPLMSNNGNLANAICGNNSGSSGNLETKNDVNNKYNDDDTFVDVNDQHRHLSNTASTKPIQNDMTSLVQRVVRDGKKYKNCTILFCDIVKFSTMVNSCSPTELIEMLNYLHDKFDRLTRIGVHRIDVVGDAYLVISGIPESNKGCSERIGNLSLAMIDASKTVKSPHDYGKPYGKWCLIRIGIHYGDVIGGIVGSSVPRFTVMGDSVVMASRMESHGVPDKIQLSSAAYRELSSYQFEITERGLINVRDKGRIFTYFLQQNLGVSSSVLLGNNPGAENLY